jgi:flavodoxin
MQVKQVSLIYFSPTGNVRKTLTKIAAGIGYPTREYDLTPFEARWKKYTFSAEDLVLVGMPVYGGRIPGNAIEFFRGIEARNTPAVFIISYGNRDYEDALLELKNSCEAKGFVGIAAATFIGEHSFLETIASGRPDLEDQQTQIQFGRQIRTKIDSLTEISSV